MASLIELLPMRWFFVGIIGFLPVALTVYERGIDDIMLQEWVSFAMITVGFLTVFIVATETSSVEMQIYLWPPLMIIAGGVLLYRISLNERGEFDESEIQRGGTSYE